MVPEEEKSAFAANLPKRVTSNDAIVEYRIGCLIKAGNFLKQTLPLALGLNDLS